MTKETSGVQLQIPQFANPFRPGAGHMPPYLAGREPEMQEFKELLQQDLILKNLILTGLRGVGKTVLLETLKPIAVKEGWMWVGTDLSEAVSVSDEALATRLLTDLAVVTSGITITADDPSKSGFLPGKTTAVWSYGMLRRMYEGAPGLVSDKLKLVLENVRAAVVGIGKRGMIFAYDEAQNISDNAEKDRFPLSLLLDVFQSIQKKGVPFMLVLTGLPTLLPKLVAARTYSERLFHTIFLKRLNDIAAREAILRPIQDSNCPIRFTPESIQTIFHSSGGYPYFIQFMCKETYDRFIQQIAAQEPPQVPVVEIIRKLDADFFAGRWGNVTDRQRDLLVVVAGMPNNDSEFTVQDIVRASQEELTKPFSSSRVSAILGSLMDGGLVYRNRHGKYRFAVPMFGQFIRRQILEPGGMY